MHAFLFWISLQKESLQLGLKLDLGGVGGGGKCYLLPVNNLMCPDKQGKVTNTKTK